MFKNCVVAITGKFSMSRQSIIKTIENNGGIVSNSISKKVTHLLCSDPSDSSSKLDKANKMGIKIITEQDLNSNASLSTTNIVQKKIELPKKVELSKKLPKKVDEYKQDKKKRKMSYDNNKNTNVVQEFDTFIKQMLSSNSNLDKQKIFIDFVETASSDFVDILKIIYHKQLKFGITSKNIIKFQDTKWNYNRDYVKMELIDFIDQLVSGDISGHDALKVALSILSDYPEDYKETLFLIFNKDLKLRFGLNLVNKAIPDFVPVFNVSLGYSYDEKTKKHTETGEWFISKKLDGVRCITIIEINLQNDDITIDFFSRGGLKFKSLVKVEEELKKFLPKVLNSLRQFKDEKESIKIVLDGEMCIIDENGNEDFKSIVSQIKRKSVIVEKPRYLVFDMLTLEEFKSEKSNRIFSDRLNIMKELFSSYETDIIKYKEESSKEKETDIIKLLPQLPFTEEMFSIMSKKAEIQKWEGLMLRKDTFYSGKRSNDLLKVKEFETEEYLVQDVVFGIFPVINEESGLQEEEEMLASVIINHKGINTVTGKEDTKEVNVGSGFSQEERKKFYNNPSLIKGKMISVQYFQTIRSKDGKESLRFPTFKGLYGSKRVI